MKLYYHKTDGGAEYLFDTYREWKHNGKTGKEGVLNEQTKYIVRIDGDIEQDAELTVRNWNVCSCGIKQKPLNDDGRCDNCQISY